MKEIIIDIMMFDKDKGVRFRNVFIFVYKRIRMIAIIVIWMLVITLSFRRNGMIW